MDVTCLEAMWPPGSRGPWMDRLPAGHGVGHHARVPTGQALISESLDSVLAQTYRPLELIVVDDGSTDGTAAVVEAWNGGRAPDPEFVLRCDRQEHSGAPAARNHGLGQSRGEFIQFFDSDDLLHPERSAPRWRAAHRGRGLDIIYGGTSYFAGRRRLGHGEPYVTFPLRGERAVTAFLRGGAAGPIRAVPSRACRAVGPWDEAAPILEDWDYAIRHLGRSAPGLRRRDVPALSPGP